MRDSRLCCRRLYVPVSQQQRKQGDSRFSQIIFALAVMLSYDRLEDVDDKA